MKTYKITPNFQITIPQDIRDLLKLKTDDSIIFKITKDKQVIMKKATSKKDVAYLKALESTLSEWNSKNDDVDYENL